MSCNLTRQIIYYPRGIMLSSLCIASLSLQACVAAQGSDLDCGPSTPSQMAARSRQQAAAAEALLAGLRKAQRAPEQVISIHPAADGDDSSRIEAALLRARQIRAETGRPSTLEFAPGRYRLRRPIVLTAADSGAPGAPLRLAAASAEPVILTGGLPLAPKPLPASLTALISPAQRNAVEGFSVPPHAVPSPAFPRRIGPGMRYTRTPALFVLQGDRPLWRAAFPETGYAVEPVAHPQPGPNVFPQVAVPRELANVAREPSLQAGGFWTFDWAYEENQLVPGVDGEARGAPLLLAMPQLHTSYPQSPLMRYRLLNGFSFITRPGQMAYADGILASLPWSASAPIEVAAIDHLIKIDGAHDVVVDGLALQGVRQDVVAIHRAHRITFSNAFIGLAAGSAITVNDSDFITVERSVIADLGDSGVAIDNDAKLPSSNILIADNVIARASRLTPAFRAAILLAGHDNVVMGNAISDLPQHAITFSGARNLILGNEIAFAVLETSDSGAITAYNDLSAVDNTIAENYIHDIATSPKLTQAGPAREVRDIYLDNWTSFTYIINNLSDTGAMSYFLNSGYSNMVKNNIWFRRGGPSGEVHDYSHSRNAKIGMAVFNQSNTLQLAACSNLAARYAPEFLRDGKPRGNRIVQNYNIGGSPVVMRPAIAGLQQVIGERMLAPTWANRTGGFGGLLDLARRDGAPIGIHLLAADRTSALRALKYFSRKEP